MCFLCTFRQLTSLCRLGIMGTICKWVMIIGNFTQSFLGPIFVGLGLAAWVVEALVNWIPFVNLNWFSAPLMATGCFIYILTMMGCIAAFKELKCLIAVYCVCIAVLLLGQIALLVYEWGDMSHVQDRTAEWVGYVFKQPHLRDTFHVLENSMNCCGAEGARSYELLGQKLPATCCKTPVPVENSTAMTCLSGDAYDGCAEVTSEYLQKLADKVGKKIYYVIGVEVIDLISSATLFQATTA